MNRMVFLVGLGVAVGTTSGATLTWERGYVHLPTDLAPVWSAPDGANGAQPPEHATSVLAPPIAPDLPTPPGDTTVAMRPVFDRIVAEGSDGSETLWWDADTLSRSGSFDIGPSRARSMAAISPWSAPTPSNRNDRALGGASLAPVPGTVCIVAGVGIVFARVGGAERRERRSILHHGGPAR